MHLRTYILTVTHGTQYSNEDDNMINITPMRLRTYLNHVTMHAGSSQTLNKHQHFQHKIVQQTLLMFVGKTLWEY